MATVSPYWCMCNSTPADAVITLLQVGDKINYVKVLDGLQNLETSRA